MKLQIVKQKGRTYYYIAKTMRLKGKSKTRIIKRLGSEEEICKQYNVIDAKKWAKDELKKINDAQKYNDSIKTSYHLISEILNQIDLNNIIKDTNDLEVLRFIVWNIICFPNEVSLNYEGFSKYSNTKISNYKIIKMLKILSKNHDKVIEAATRYYLKKFRAPSDELYIWSGKIHTPYLFSNSKDKLNIATYLYFSSEGIPAYFEHKNNTYTKTKKLLYKKVSDIKAISQNTSKDATNSFSTITELNYSNNRDYFLEIENDADFKWEKARFKSIFERTSAKNYLVKFKRITGKIKNKDIIITKANSIEDLDYLLWLYSIQGLNKFGSPTTQNNSDAPIDNINYKDFGYRAYIVPKNTDIELITLILYTTIEYQITFNWNYLDITKILAKSNSIKIFKAYQLVQFISVLTRAVLCCYSGYNINNMWSLAWFMERIDSGNISEGEIKKFYSEIYKRLFEA